MVLMPLLSRLLTLLVILTMPLFLARLTSSVNSRERSGINTILHELNPLFTINVTRSEERFSRNAETDLVCRLLLEKKKKHNIQRAIRVLPAGYHPVNLQVIALILVAHGVD